MPSLYVSHDDTHCIKKTGKNMTWHPVSVYLKLRLRVRPVICGMYGVASLSVLYPLPPSISAILACTNSTSPSTFSSFSGILKEKEAKAILQLYMSTLFWGSRTRWIRDLWMFCGFNAFNNHLLSTSQLKMIYSELKDIELSKNCTVSSQLSTYICKN